jgi:hypothetical protein
MRAINQILDEYDPNHDVGRVTWADERMATAILDLAERVAALEEQNKDLQARLAALEAVGAYRDDLLTSLLSGEEPF